MYMAADLRSLKGISVDTSNFFYLLGKINMH